MNSYWNRITISQIIQKVFKKIHFQVLLLKKILLSITKKIFLKNIIIKIKIIYKLIITMMNNKALPIIMKINRVKHKQILKKNIIM
jgi:hypothetical protein